MDIKNALCFKDRNSWRKWLENNHDKINEVWLSYYKKRVGKPSITHEEAVEEALCFGWIDSKVKSIDDERFIQKYTPRSDDSVWSKINKDTVERLIKEDWMTKAGLAKIEIAKIKGTWQSAYTSKKKLPIPIELKEALMRNRIAWGNFNKFATSYQNMYIGWIASAKRESTKKKRIEKVMENSIANKKLIVFNKYK